MVFLAALTAFASEHPLPPHAEAGPIEGFVAVWVKPTDLLSHLGAAVTPAAPAHQHSAPGGIGVLELDEGVHRSEVIEAIQSDPDLVRAELNEEGTKLLVEHPDFVALLAHPLGKGTVGDAVSVYPAPRGILRMPGPSGQDLPVENVSSARAVVSVDGLEIGEIGPYARGVVHGVPSGTYTLAFRLPNGYVRQARAHTAEGLTYEAPYRMR